MADPKKLTQMTEVTLPLLTDLAYTVINPGSVPQGMKMPWQSLLTLFLAQNVARYADASVINNKVHKQLWLAGWMNAITSGCGDQYLDESSTNKVNMGSFPFDKDAIEYAFVNVAMPDDYAGGDVYAKFYWKHLAGTAFKVSWGLQAVGFGDGDALDAAYGTAQYANDEGGTAGHLYISPLTAAITPAGTPAAGDFVSLRALRKADDGSNDTLDADAYLIGVMLWYPVE
ncbi:MAG TPA: hypothetical protein DDW19_01810 [Anaerolineaceae bacterium]|jgi:hypothetical protein|nr:hypothetical protein [Anaerolineaceae bacterium]